MLSTRVDGRAPNSSLTRFSYLILRSKIVVLPAGIAVCGRVFVHAKYLVQRDVGIPVRCRWISWRGEGEPVKYVKIGPFFSRSKVFGVSRGDCGEAPCRSEVAGKGSGSAASDVVG